MGYGFKASAGGGSHLNFSVKTYATEEALLAAAPKENTIGVITETPMTGWVVDVNEPTASVNGVVWISTGTSSTVEFNALKKNGIQVYPIYAKQYTSGAWVYKPAKSYQGGKWLEWIKVLFDNGSVVPWSIASTHSNYVSIDQKITIDGLGSRYPVAYATDKIDVTNYTKLKATVKYLSGNVGDSTFGAYIGVNPVLNQSLDSWEAHFTSKDKTETNFEVNISNVSDERYILIGCYGVNYEFTKVWLE